MSSKKRHRQLLKERGEGKVGFLCAISVELKRVLDQQSRDSPSERTEGSEVRNVSSLDRFFKFQMSLLSCVWAASVEGL